MEKEDIKIIKLANPTDIIVYKFDINQLTYEDVHNFYQYLVDKFPENKVIGIPKNSDIDIMDWQRLYDYVMSIKPEGEVK